MTAPYLAIDTKRMGFLATFVLDRTGDSFPQSARHRAALLLLDTLGVCVAATPMQAGVIARKSAQFLYGAGRADHSARILFDGTRVSLAGAAFAAASQIDNLDGHDGYSPTKGHIGVAVVPALAAVAEQIPQLSGIDALVALIVGYEIAGRAGLALHASVSDYHTSGAWNALGVAALAARLCGGDQRQLRQALGIAEYHGPRSQMMREIAFPSMLHDGSGMGALVGLSAIVMAEQGFVGEPAITVEASDAAPHWADLGKFWQIEEQYIKPYPVCRWAHAAIDAALELCLEHDLKPNDIAAVTISSFHNAVQLFSAMPDTTSKAQYSLQFAVATMLVHRSIGLQHITGAGLSDHRVAAMLERITTRASPRHEQRFPKGRWADLEIRLHNGRILGSGDVQARGGPERPFSQDDIIAKFHAFAAPVLGKARALAIEKAVLGLTRPDSRFTDLSGLLYESP